MTEHETGGTPGIQVQELLLESQDITEFLDAFTTTIAQALTTNREQMWCAVTLLRPKRSTTVAASSSRAEALDEIQYHYGDGPCLTAAREHRVVHVADTRTDRRWPEYGKAAAQAGVLSALGVPLDLGGEAIAGQDLYADRPGAFDAAILEVVQRQVTSASGALRLAMQSRPTVRPRAT
jgi:GAF domain-containing protein